LPAADLVLLGLLLGAASAGCTKRIQLVLFGMWNRTSDPCLAAIYRRLISVTIGVRVICNGGAVLPCPQPMNVADLI
jgi:hypothetical protein